MADEFCAYPDVSRSKRRKLALFLMNFPLIWSFTGMFWLPKGVNFVPPLVIAACVSAIYLNGIKCVRRKFLTTPLSLLLLVMSVYCIFQYIYHGSSSQEMRAYITCFLFVGCFNKKTFEENHILMLLVAAACGVLATTIIQAYFISIARVHGHINPIVYATYSGSIAIICFSLFINRKRKLAGKTFLLLSMFIFLVICTIMTGTRGVWIALFGGIVYITWIEYKHIIFKRKINLLILPVVVIAAGAFLYSFSEDRIKTTLNEIEQLKSGRMENNIGIRLELWSAAKELAFIAPIFGLGDSHSVELEELYKERKIGMRTFKQSHYHNHYLDAFVKKGAVGLILLLLLIAYPVFAYKRYGYQPWQKNIALCLFIIYLISGLTDVPLNHAPTIYFYVFSILIFTNSPKLLSEQSL